MKYKTTADIEVPKRIVEQIIGQDSAVEIIKKAASQRRHVLLIGIPGTGKSMLGQALAELMPKSKLQDILVLPNLNDENEPIVKALPAGKGKELYFRAKMRANASSKNQHFLFFTLALISIMIPWWIRNQYGDIMAAASLLAGMMFIVALAVSMNFGMRKSKTLEPKLLIDNSSAKQAPFIDATGAKAGALLGDVKHDPFQCFSQGSIAVLGKQTLNEMQMPRFVDNIIDKSNKQMKDKYIAAHVKSNVIILGDNGHITPVDVLSVNKHEHKGKVIRFVTETGKELIVTPEHKVKVERGKSEYVEANSLNVGDNVFCSSDIIIGEQDIIATYPEKEQKSARDYIKFIELKKQNTAFGYKRLAKLLSIKHGQTRWWHNKKHKPISIQTIEWLKERNLLPLKIDNPNLPVIARVLGTTFGDGGVFANLNGIFLSSAEKSAVEEFGEDLKKIFGNTIAKNSLLRESGEYGHSWQLLNTNRKIIRFFQAVGAPVGNKTKINLNVPNWLVFNSNAEDEFFGAFFGNELGVPKVHKQKNRLQTLDISLMCTEEFKDNRLAFFKQIKLYLNRKGVVTNQIYKQYKRNNVLLRLGISIKLDNVIKFRDNIAIRYCDYKPKKLSQAISEFKRLKHEKYNNLLGRGYGAEHAMKLLNINPQLLYQILNEAPNESS